MQALTVVQDDWSKGRSLTDLSKSLSAFRGWSAVPSSSPQHTQCGWGWLHSYTPGQADQSRCYRTPTTSCGAVLDEQQQTMPDLIESLPKQSCPFVTVWTNPNWTVTLEPGLCFVQQGDASEPAPGTQGLTLLGSGKPPDGTREGH